MATLKAVLFTGKKYTNNKYPVMLRVTHRKKSKYWSVSKGDERFQIDLKQWDEENQQFKLNKRLNPDYEELNSIIAEKRKRLRTIIEEFERRGIAWTLNLLDERYVGKVNYTHFLTYIDDRIEKKLRKNKISTVKSYRQLIIDLKTAFGEKKLNKLEMADIDYDFVQNFIDYGEAEIQKRNKIQPRWKPGGIRLRLGLLKATLNAAIKDGVGSRETFPFSDIYGATKWIVVNDYESDNDKKRIPVKYVDKFVDYPCYYMYQMRLLKHIIFTRLIGIEWQVCTNLKDKFLKYKVIDGKRVLTLCLNKKDHKVDRDIVINDQLQTILNWFEKYTDKYKDYIFPICDNKDKVDDWEKYKRHLMHNACNIARKQVLENGLPEITTESFDQWNAVEIFIPHLKKSKELFLFSYYAQGMNFRDMAFLRNDDIKMGYDEKTDKNFYYFKFNRSKTNVKIKVDVSEKLFKIIDYFSKNEPGVDGYLLPIITDSTLRGEKAYDDILVQKRKMNRNIKTIAKECNFPPDLRKIHSYFARHTAATRLYELGLSKDNVAKALGHTNTKMTDRYLDEIMNNEIGRISKDL